MSEAMIVIAVLLTLLGLTWLALSQDKHARALTVPAQARPRLRWLGLTAILLALATLVWVEGPSFATLWATVLVGALAPLVAAALAWRPTLLRPLAFGLRSSTKPTEIGSLVRVQVRPPNH